MGFIFLWPFFDKLLGLGFATAASKSWLLGNSPTYGFLTFGTKGPLVFIFKAMAGNVFVDWVFMVELLFIGISLLLGIARKISCYGGTLMLFLMWLAAIPPENNPIIDEHIIYGLILLVLANIRTNFSLTKKWEKLSFVKKNEWLK